MLQIVWNVKMCNIFFCWRQQILIFFLRIFEIKVLRMVCNVEKDTISVHFDLLLWEFTKIQMLKMVCSVEETRYSLRLAKYNIKKTWHNCTIWRLAVVDVLENSQLTREKLLKLTRKSWRLKFRRNNEERKHRTQKFDQKQTTLSRTRQSALSTCTWSSSRNMSVSFWSCIHDWHANLFYLLNNKNISFMYKHSLPKTSNMLR